MLLFALGVVLLAPPEPPPGESPAAERTRTKLLPVKVSGSFRGVPLREVLKEFAHQVDGEAGRPVLWTYAGGVDGGTKVTFACKEQALETALPEVLKQAKAEFVVLSEDDGPRDGWVLVGGPAEVRAYRLLVQAQAEWKDRPADAAAVLRLVVKKYAGTRAAARAAVLLKESGK